MSDEFDLGPQVPRPVRPVGFDLDKQWTEYKNETGGDSAADGLVLGDRVGSSGATEPTLTKDEAIILAKLIVAYPFLQKVL